MVLTTTVTRSPNGYVVCGWSVTRSPVWQDRPPTTTVRPITLQNGSVPVSSSSEIDDVIGHTTWHSALELSSSHYCQNGRSRRQHSENVLSTSAPKPASHIFIATSSRCPSTSSVWSWSPVQRQEIGCKERLQNGLFGKPHSVSCGWFGSRVISVLVSGAEGPGFKSQSRRCRVTVLGKLFTPIVPLFIKQRNW